MNVEPSLQESARLDSLRRHRILDTPSDPDLDKLTELAGYICGAPIAILSFVDSNRVWFKSKIGIDLREIPREFSFCNHTISRPEAFVVIDTEADNGFKTNAFVQSQGIRAYTGVPLITTDHHPLGALCVMDRKPMQLRDDQIAAMERLAWVAVSHIESNRASIEVQESEARFFQILDGLPLGIVVYDLRSRPLFANRVAVQILGMGIVPDSNQLSEVYEPYVAGSDRQYPHEQLPMTQALAGRAASVEDLELRKGGSAIPLEVFGMPIRDELGRVQYAVAAFQDLSARRKAEQQLRESEERYRELFENATDLVYTSDMDGTFTTMNKAAEAITGYPREEVINKMSVEKVVVPEHIPMAREMMRRKMQGQEEHTPYELQITRKDGQRIILELDTRLIMRDGRPAGAQGIARDITSRKRAERRLTAEHAVTRVLAESLSLQEAGPKILQAICDSLDWEMGAMWSYDQTSGMLRCVETGHPPGLEIPELDEQTRQLRFPPGTGLPGRVWVSRKAIWIPDVLKEPNFPAIPYASEIALRSALGIPILLGGEILGVLDFFSLQMKEPDEDLLQMLRSIGNQVGQFIQRIRTEEALRASEERFKSLFENVPIGVYRSTPAGRIQDANSAMLKMFGFDSLEDMAAWDLEEYARATGYPRQLFKETIDKEGEITGLEVMWRKKDGTPIYIRENARGIRDEKGQIVCYEGTVEDVTDRKRIEQVKDELISIVSHELRTPITSIQGSLSYLSDRMRDQLSERAQRMVDLALRSSDRMIRLINDLLDLDKIESGKMQFRIQPLEITPLVQQTIEVNQPYAEQFGVKYVFHEGLPGARVNADGDRLVQVLTNLLSNAAKFSPSQEEVLVSVSRNESIVRVAVKDRGQGIPDHFRDRIFQKFAQAGADPRHKKGTGLGLSISKAIVERLGGTIGFESDIGHGATFYFDLPEYK